ncbi:MAG: zinc-finger domain-containing protein [Proteobacteria bacterium]|nr:zinc-finger domain-containing protein [Pseudomonadota bacterium]MCH9758503.1 zinc-finger domain-containing protein [Pseudomonadota bacterium]
MSQIPPRSVNIKTTDLPFACPPPGTAKWNMHPRVFIQISAKQPQQSCPYCGTRYVLTDDTEAK